MAARYPVPKKPGPQNQGREEVLLPFIRIFAFKLRIIELE
jgi:hypothetical protein